MLHCHPHLYISVGKVIAEAAGKEPLNLHHDYQLLTLPHHLRHEQLDTVNLRQPAVQGMLSLLSDICKENGADHAALSPGRFVADDDFLIKSIFHIPNLLVLAPGEKLWPGRMDFRRHDDYEAFRQRQISLQHFVSQMACAEQLSTPAQEQNLVPEEWASKYASLHQIDAPLNMTIQNGGDADTNRAVFSVSMAAGQSNSRHAPHSRGNQVLCGQDKLVCSQIGRICAAHRTARTLLPL